MVRRNDPVSSIARWLESLPEARRRAILREMRAALREAKNAGAVPLHDDDADLGHPHEATATKYRRHLRFSEGGLTVVNSAWSARADAAWQAAAETGQRIQQRQRGRRG